MSIALPARNLGIADSMETIDLLIPCSACYNRMLVAQKRLATDPELMEEINGELEKKVTGKTQVVSILKVLSGALESGLLTEKIVKKIEGLMPVCYYGCLQTRFPYDVHVEDDIENPQAMERILSALGANPIDWSYKTSCCGASASINDTELSLDLMAGIMRDALSRDANCFVTSCPMCQQNLDAYQKQFCKAHGIEEEMPVMFITEAVGLAMGKSPEEIQIERHFVDATGLLQELSLI